jgi:hypothetical protein
MAFSIRTTHQFIRPTSEPANRPSIKPTELPQPQTNAAPPPPKRGGSYIQHTRKGCSDFY